MNNFEKLSTLCSVITDGSHYSPVSIEEGIPMLSVKDMTDLGFNYDNCNHITNEEYAKMLQNGCVPQVNDVLIAKDGSYLKHVFVIEKAKEQAILSSIGILRPNRTLIDSYYLKYYLSSDFVKKQVAKKYVSGSALPRIILKNFKDIDIPMVGLNEQKKISSVLKNIDDKILNNNKIISELESMAKTIYDYWFLQFEFPNEDGKPYKSSGGKMVWNDELKREIPEGWKVTKLDKCVETIIDRRGVTPKKLGGDWVDEGIIALSAKVVKNGRLLDLSAANKVSEEMYDKWMPTKLVNGDILMTSEAPLGEFYYLYNEPKYCLSQRLFAIRAKKHLSSLYLYYELSKGNGFSQIKGSSSGSTVFGIRQDELRQIKILIPNEKVMQSFQSNVIEFISLQHSLDRENQELASLRDFLLPLLMNGQVTFKEDDK